MSNKKRDRLHPLDKYLRERYPVRGFCRDYTSIEIKISLTVGFEYFNTRPYHNYETWSDGYFIEAVDEHGQKFTAKAEDLDDALMDLLDGYHGLRATEARLKKQDAEQPRSHSDDEKID